MAVLPVENSYAGSIHENLYRFVSSSAKVMGEIHVPVCHCFCSLEVDMTAVTQAYSHPQALSQCRNFLAKRGIVPVEFYDTA